MFPLTEDKVLLKFYAGDSVTGAHCSFGAGTINANWRFDNKTVQVKVGDTMIDTGRDKNRE